MRLDRIRIVLVRPKTSGNVGAVARAMKNMGLSDLVVVAPRRFRRVAADSMAVHATDVLDRMRVVRSIAEAVADCHWVAGTTVREGVYRRRTVTPREIAPTMLALAAHQRVALVFGPEDTGLSNDDLKSCDELVTIPADAAYPSLNVAQAVLVCAYELHLAERPTRTDAVPLASVASVDFMLARLRDACLAIGFLPASNPDHILLAIRRLFGRARLEPREVRIWLGLARQIEWFARGGRETVALKRNRGAPVR
ncbi:MAG: tRNA/rRNA methyltransferase [Candidatus Binatota bacterium]|nr:tRNA/rRNA methyltransferase [Candidatus Binatota bacterium]